MMDKFRLAISSNYWTLYPDRNIILLFPIRVIEYLLLIAIGTRRNLSVIIETQDTKEL